MNIYKDLNKMIDYIEDNLENKINYDELAKIVGMNKDMLQRFFSVLCNISIAEYIRRRRLSNAGQDFINNRTAKVLDTGLKYQYANATAFARAFEDFHGVKASKVKQGYTNLKVFPRMHFNEDEQKDDEDIEYSIINTEEMIKYGKRIRTTVNTIREDAPLFCKIMECEYRTKYTYGMTEYVSRFEDDECFYWLLFDKYVPSFKKVIIPASKWLCFKVDSMDARDIQRVVKNFYTKFLPSSKYKIKEMPELEYYHDGKTDFLVPIE